MRPTHLPSESTPQQSSNGLVWCEIAARRNAGRTDRNLPSDITDSATETDGHSDRNEEEGEFIRYDGGRKKRRRMRSQQQQASTSGRPAPDARSNDTTGRPRRQPLLVGRKTSVSPQSIHAAKPLQRKAVFCIDNIEREATEDDIRGFVTNLGVRVITCFKVKPRRSTRQKHARIIPSDRVAFRLCIDRDDSDKLLVPERWPADVTISRWFFQLPNASADNDEYHGAAGPDDTSAKHMDTDDHTLTFHAGNSPHS